MKRSTELNMAVLQIAARPAGSADCHVADCTVGHSCGSRTVPQANRPRDHMLVASGA